MSEEVENKVRGILGLYNFYKYKMNTIQRVALLTLWIDVCINKEEYEVAAGLQKELDKIISGEEEYFVISPSDMLELQKEEIEQTIVENLEINSKTVKKKLRFISNWGSKGFELFSLSFNSFRIVFFNFGFELK
jgi:hypothetical protein